MLYSIEILPSIWTCDQLRQTYFCCWCCGDWCGHAWNELLLQFLYNYIKKSNNSNRFANDELTIIWECYSKGTWGTYSTYFSYCFVACNNHLLHEDKTLEIICDLWGDCRNGSAMGQQCNLLCHYNQSIAEKALIFTWITYILYSSRKIVVALKCQWWCKWFQRRLQFN